MHPAFISWLRNGRRDHHGCDGEGAHPGHAGHGHDGFGRGFHAGRSRGGPFPRPFSSDGPPFGEGFFAGHGHGPWSRDESGGFGVRRPLRFLAHKLDLSEAQVGELARILDALKTERAQAEVDQRRTITAFADAIEGTSFGDERAREGGDLRVKSAERLREAVMTALGKIHALLDEEQRKHFAYLVRTGVVSL